MRLLFAIAIILFSCSEQSEEPNPQTPAVPQPEDEETTEVFNLIIDKIIVDGKTGFDFHYENDQLVKIDLYNTYEGEIYGSRLYFYEDDLIIRMEEVYTTGFNQRTHTFTYENGKIVRSDETAESGYVSFDIYSYDDKERLMRFEKYEGTEEPFIEDDNLYFEYDENDKLTRLISPEVYIPSLGEYVDLMVNIKVDDKINPFKSLPYRAFQGLLHSNIYPIPNNVVVAESEFFGTKNDYQHEYNEQNYPVSFINSDGFKVEYKYVDE